MILIDKTDNYNFQFGFNQTQDYIINSLETLFIEKHGESIYHKCDILILVQNNNFYHVIRNKYKVRVSGELVSNLCSDIKNYL